MDDVGRLLAQVSYFTSAAAFMVGVFEAAPLSRGDAWAAAAFLAAQAVWLRLLSTGN